jgi:putative redox protein
MKKSVESSFTGGMSWSTEIDGHEYIMDANDEFGGNGKGASPKPFLLMSLAGCTGMDVVSLLKKMRVEFEDLKISVDANLTDEHPKIYDTMHITYKFWGVDESNHSKVLKAVNLSKERYCGVSAMLEKASKLTFEVVYN